MLCRDHSAAIIDCTFCQRVSRIECSLCFHVDNKANHILLCCIIRCGRSNRIKANIITHRSLSQRRILIIASSYYFGSLRKSICIINVNTNRANLWSSLDILLISVFFWNITSVSSKLRKPLMQTFSNLIIFSPNFLIFFYWEAHKHHLFSLPRWERPFMKLIAF